MEPATRLLDEKETAKYLGMSRVYLRKLRMLGGATRNPGPAFVRIGARSIRYDRADLDAYIEARKVRPAAMGE